MKQRASRGQPTFFFLERTCNTDGQQIVRRPHGKERISHTQIIQAPWHGEASFGSASSLAQPDREEDEARGPDPYPDRRGRSIHTVVCAWITHEKEMTNGDASFASAQWRPGLSPQSLLRLGLDADPTCPDHVMEILRLLIILPPWMVHHIHGFK